MVACHCYFGLHVTPIINWCSPNIWCLMVEDNKQAGLLSPGIFNSTSDHIWQYFRWVGNLHLCRWSSLPHLPWHSLMLRRNRMDAISAVVPPMLYEARCWKFHGGPLFGGQGHRVLFNVRTCFLNWFLQGRICGKACAMVPLEVLLKPIRIYWLYHGGRWKINRRKDEICPVILGESIGGRQFVNLKPLLDSSQGLFLYRDRSPWVAP